MTSPYRFRASAPLTGNWQHFRFDKNDIKHRVTR